MNALSRDRAKMSAADVLRDAANRDIKAVRVAVKAGIVKAEIVHPVHKVKEAVRKVKAAKAGIVKAEIVHLVHKVKEVVHKAKAADRKVRADLKAIAVVAHLLPNSPLVRRWRSSSQHA